MASFKAISTADLIIMEMMYQTGGLLIKKGVSNTQVTFYLEFHLRHWKIVSREKLLNGNWFHHIFHARQSFWWASYQLQMVWYAKRYQNNFAKYLAPFSVQISFEWKTPSCGSKTPTTSKMELLLALVNSFQ